MTRQFWANLALCIVLGVLAIFFVTQAGSALTPTGLFMSEPKPSNEAAKMLQDVVLTKYQMGENLEHMVEAEFYVQNNSSLSVKNVSVVCEFFDEKEMYRDRKIWKIADTIPAKHQVKISSLSKRFVNTQAQALNCSITDFQLVKKPFFTLERQVAAGHGQAASESGHGKQSPAGH